MATVLLDCDGILANFTGFVLDVIREEFGREYGPDDVTEWDFGNLLETPEERRILRSEMRAIGVANTLERLEDPDGVGPWQAVHEIRGMGHRVVCVTTPMPGSPAWCWERLLWLETETGIGRRDVVFASDKSLIVGDYLVDDKRENCNEWAEARRGHGKALLWDRPYNQGPVDGARVYCWSDVFDELRWGPR